GRVEGGGVRGGGRGGGGEEGAGVADGDPVGEELAGPRHRRGEVDRTEDQHPWRRGEGLDEHRQVVEPALAVLAVVPDSGQALREHAARIVVDRLVQPAASPEGPRG